jgi:N-acetyl-gamma-glutamyl-phosphate reductase
MTKVFIDGSAGTTGLRIRQRLAGRSELTLLTLPEEVRKDPAARKEAMNGADIVFLCLPDAAATEAVSLVENPRTCVIDTSTAHRTDPGWVYGFPELVGKDRVAASNRIANPGCHASGFIALVKPLTDAGLIDKGAALSCFSLTGYSGGGKSMIAQYEAPDRDPLLGAPRQYALGQQHKHLKEMVLLCSLEKAPVFCPIVADFYSGMEVTVPLFAGDLKGSPEDIKNAYKAAYTGPLVHFDEGCDEGGFLSAAAYSGFDDMEISVSGSGERILLTARFDNLGKGASGAAIQNMNIRLGLAETAGLSLSERKTS